MSKNCQYCKGKGWIPTAFGLTLNCLRCDGTGNRSEVLWRKVYELGYSDAMSAMEIWLKDLLDNLPVASQSIADMRKRIVLDEKAYERHLDAKIFSQSAEEGLQDEP